ncbi:MULTISPECIES: sulfatase-like hydrolase/transferase [unclassified Lysobacter]
MLPNLLFALLGRVWFIDRAWVNLDYLIVGAVCIWLGNRVVAFAVFVLICADLLFAIAPGYHLSIASVLGSATELLSLGPVYVVTQTGLVLAVAGLCTWLMAKSWVCSRSKPIVTVTCLVMALVAVVVDVRVSGHRVEALGASVVAPNLAASTANSLRIALATWDSDPGDQVQQSMAAASSVLGDRLASADPMSRHIVLVLVESLGSYVDADLNSLQLRAFDGLADNPRFAVQSSGYVGFEGSTVPAELRELCGIRMLSVHPDPDALPAENCLPARMRKAGYTTLAAHGFMGTFFSRNLWYPALGFDEIWFGSRFSQLLDKPRRCGVAFNGVCDRAAWKALVEHVRQLRDQRTFSYWLTISTHLPVPSPDASIDQAICEAHPVSRANPEVCNLLAWHNALFVDIVHSLQTRMPGDTTIVLVGDHAPPFLDAGTRALFDPARVPYVVIAPVPVQH